MTVPASSHLPSTACPICGRPMTCTALRAGERVPVATTFRDCLRQCSACQVGLSNGRTNPTLIHDDPLANVPLEVRPGALETLADAINVRNRDNKLKRFAYSTSEDAVTWTVFSFLTQCRRDVLLRMSEAVFGLGPSEDVSALLWGVPITLGERGLIVQAALLAEAAVLGEDPQSCSEPDVVLDYGEAGLVFIEVKYLSGNDRRSEANWHRYLPGAVAFRDPEQARASGLYELVRNWRFVHDLAAGRPFALINLAPATTLAATKGMDAFVASLSPAGRFIPVEWSSFLTALEDEGGPMPRWLASYLTGRGLR